MKKKTRYQETLNFFKLAFEKEANYAWMNTGVVLSDITIDKLKDALHSLGSNALVIVPSIERTRPQRTSGVLPSYFRPLAEFKKFGVDPEANPNNTFIFALTSDIYDEEKFSKLLLSLPKCHYTTIFPVEFKKQEDA